MAYSCQQITKLFLSVLKAGFTRLLFAGHIFVTVWRVTDVYQDNIYWLLLLFLGGMLLEFIVIMYSREGKEWNW